MDINCPACGSAISAHIKYAKLIVCPHCRISLFLEDDAVKQAGQMSVLTEQPSILTLNQRFCYNQTCFVPVGHIRYNYPKGFWDEWWVLNDDGSSAWVSIDEGDVAIENIVEKTPEVPPFPEIQIGQKIIVGGDILTVTEKNNCRCTGIEGELPFIINPDETFNYVDLSAPPNLIYTIEYFTDGIECFKGKWIDSFEIKMA